jgi:hypothetical protein
VSRSWSVPRCWEGATVAVLASGPSMCAAQVELVRRSGAKAVVVNRTRELMPDADWLHGSDARFWAAHPAARVFPGTKTTTAPSAAGDGVELLGLRPGFDPRDRTSVFDAKNSGLEAMCVAVLTGARRVVLIGFDARDQEGVAHWHEDHPEPDPSLVGTSGAGNPCGWHFKAWRTRADRLAAILARHRVEVLNATPGSAYRCWPGVDLAEALR